MQDNRTGHMLPIEMLEGIPEFKGTPRSPVAIADSMLRSAEMIQRAKDVALPDRSRQGAVFFTGEELEIKGARFRVAEILATGLILEGLPLLASDRAVPWPASDDHIPSARANDASSSRPDDHPGRRDS